MIAFLLVAAATVQASADDGVAELEKLYRLKCGRCHTAYPAEKYSGEDWETIVAEMVPRSGLDEETQEGILAYLRGAASKGSGGGLPTTPVLSGYLYTEYFASPAAVDTFDVHYLNLAVSGRLHERVSYKAEFEFEHGGGKSEPPFVEQAFIDVKLTRGLNLRIGAMLTPFNRFDDLHGPLENPLVTRLQISREIGVSAWKEVGVDLHGSLPLHDDFFVFYDAYAINELGGGSRLRGSRQYRDNNDAKSLGARVGGVIADRWELGASYYRGAWDDEGELDLTSYGFHLLGRVQELTLHLEFARSRSENYEPTATGEAEGFFLASSYLFGGRLRPTVRFGTLDYLDPGDLLNRKTTDRNPSTLAFGVNFHLTSGVVFKAEYDLITEGDRHAEEDNNLLAFQAAVRF